MTCLGKRIRAERRVLGVDRFVRKLSLIITDSQSTMLFEAKCVRVPPSALLLRNIKEDLQSHGIVPGKQ